MTTRISRKLLALLALVLFFNPALQAFDIAAGLNIGKRLIDDPFIRDVYGHGYVFQPFLRYNYTNLLAIEAAYEGGYKRDGRIGLFQEESTLSITGWELSGILYYRIHNFVPFIRFGVGYYDYRQDIVSEFVHFEVDNHKITYIMGGGITIFLNNSFFLNTEVKYIPFKVTPVDIEVDLSGMRFMLGIGYRFAF